jgi:hypothetical protein
VLKLSWLVAVPQGARSDLRVILWWEQRRLPYNVIVGGVGLISLLLFELAISRAGAVKPGDDPVEPVAVLATALAMNIAYTAGWVVEIVMRRLSPEKSLVIGPALLKLGLTFSVALVLLPAAWWGAVWASHAVLHRQMTLQEASSLSSVSWSYPKSDDSRLHFGS